YMAPEQLEDAKSVGPPADVFAWGAVVYECLTGAPVFPGQSAQQRIVSAVRGRIRPILALRPDAPPGLAALVERALARAAADRFADGRGLVAALDAEPRARRRTAWLAAAVVSVALGAGALATRWAQPRPAAPPL